MWRKEGWDAIEIGNKVTPYDYIPDHFIEVLVEAGADAMLEALVKDGGLEECHMVNEDPEQEE